MPKPNKVGFVGLGAMGIGMATQLLKKGFEVAAVEVREEVKDRWISAGGEWCESPSAAAIDADVFVAMVVNAEQIESVLFGGKGALKKLRPNSVIIVTSTVSPSFSRELGKRLGDSGHLFIDAPVSGGVVGAESGGLSIMASGSDEAFELVNRFSRRWPPGSIASEQNPDSARSSRRSTSCWLDLILRSPRKRWRSEPVPGWTQTFYLK